MALTAACAAAAAASDAPALRRGQVFTEYSELAGTREIARRMLTPLTARRFEEALQRSGGTLRPQAISLQEERFVVFVPTTRPPGGYGLLVFVPPWQQPALPESWLDILDERGVIAVSAARSGNPEPILDRRVPLALHAYESLRRQYRIDSEKVWIAGMSGGARVALQMLVAYPDVFRGAFLNAGSDPLGDENLPLPSIDRLRRLQAARLVYASGSGDAIALRNDERSRQSMARWCVFDVRQVPMRGQGHEPASARVFARVVDQLEAPPQPHSARLDRCHRERAREVERALAEVDSLWARGRLREARKRLDEVDIRYGGMAMPRSGDLDAQLQPRLRL